MLKVLNYLIIKYTEIREGILSEQISLNLYKITDVSVLIKYYKHNSYLELIEGYVFILYLLIDHNGTFNYENALR